MDSMEAMAKRWKRRDGSDGSAIAMEAMAMGWCDDVIIVMGSGWVVL